MSEIKKRVKLLYIVPSLDDGGAQRFTVHFLKHISRQKFEIVLLLLAEGGELVHLIPSDIKVIRRSHSRTAFSIFSVLSVTWKERPEVLFSTLGHLNLIISFLCPFFPSGTIVVARETNFISLRNKDERYPKLFNFLFKTVYKNLDLIICQSESMREDLEIAFGIKRGKLCVINNPVDISFIESNSNGNIHVKDQIVKLLSVGRLAPQKGYDRILRAMSLIDRSKFQYTILGQGPLKEELEELAIELKLDNIEFVGYSQNPYQYMNVADCLLLGSRYEGLPNVVLEANACGTPVIAFNSPGGVAEIIISGINGWLVPDGDIEKFAVLIESRCYLKADRETIKSHVKNKYSMNSIMGQYENKLLALTNSSSHR